MRCALVIRRQLLFENFELEVAVGCYLNTLTVLYIKFNQSINQSVTLKTVRAHTVVKRRRETVRRGRLLVYKGYSDYDCVNVKRYRRSFKMRHELGKGLYHFVCCIFSVRLSASTV